MAEVSLTKALKRYGQTQVIHGVDLDIKDGEFCVFVGPSGCGKSTLLRMIAGLEETTEGQIFIGTNDVTDVDPADRGIAMVFQSYALYPHMSVRENMGFGLKMNNVAKEEIEAKVSRAADILRLEPYLDRKPKALSGGQRQRVAIGRAIVRGPEVFLFDEPLSNLDAELRLEMRVELSRLHDELGTTMIYVTHDQVEAMTLADKIVVLRDGHIEQVGAPMALYEKPANRFVAGFIGSPAMNFLDVDVTTTAIKFPGVSGLKPTAAMKKHKKITLGIRPEHLSISKNGAWVVNLIEELGGVTYLYLTGPNKERVTAETREYGKHKKGDKVGISFKMTQAHAFYPKSGLRI